MRVTFVVPGVPKGKERPRVIRDVSGRPHAYTPTATKNKEKAIARLYLENANGYKFTDKPLKVALDFFYPIPSSWTRVKKELALQGKITPCVKPDLDNAAKLIMDALNGVAYPDDKQILALAASKRYGEPARSVVTIEDMEV